MFTPIIHPSRIIIRSWKSENYIDGWNWKLKIKNDNFQIGWFLKDESWLNAAKYFCSLFIVRTKFFLDKELVSLTIYVNRQSQYLRRRFGDMKDFRVFKYFAVIIIFYIYNLFDCIIGGYFAFSFRFVYVNIISSIKNYVLLLTGSL